ncbi:MAG: AbrB/MazE/SpoVT family DNA-binding domain-containing protein [Chloroflexia bacterium]
MQARIQRWGNSLALRIPKTFAIELGLASDAPVELTLVGGKLVIEPTAAPEYSLEDLLAGVTDENIHEEIGCGSPVGKEIW